MERGRQRKTIGSGSDDCMYSGSWMDKVRNATLMLSAPDLGLFHKVCINVIILPNAVPRPMTGRINWLAGATPTFQSGDEICRFECFWTFEKQSRFSFPCRLPEIKVGCKTWHIYMRPSNFEGRAC
jgi:hypothetical protein